MKHLIYTEKNDISVENYESHNDSDCSINCWSKSINDCNRTTTRGISMASPRSRRSTRGGGGCCSKGSWLTAPYGDSPDALFFCGAGLRQFTGVSAYGCGNGPEGGQILPTSFLGGGCGGFGGGCGGCGGFGGLAAAVAASAAAVAASAPAVAASAAAVAASAAAVAVSRSAVALALAVERIFGGPFGLHRHVIQDTTQANNCQRGDPNAGSVAGFAACQSDNVCQHNGCQQ